MFDNLDIEPRISLGKKKRRRRRDSELEIFKLECGAGEGDGIHAHVQKVGLFWVGGVRALALGGNNKKE